MSSKLPPRLYYSLKQAAKEIGCDEDYLIHMGGADMVEIMQFAEIDDMAYPMIRFPANCEDDPELADLLMMTYDNPHGCFYVHTPTSIRRFELTGKEFSAFFLDILYPSMSRQIYSAKSRYESTLEEIKKRLSIDARFLGFILQPYGDTEDGESGSPDSELIFDEIHPQGPAYLQIDPERLFVRQAEVERVKRGEIKPEIFSPQISEQQTISPEPKTKTRNTYLRIIDAMRRLILNERDAYLPDSKAARFILDKLADADIAPPVSDRKLIDYLKAARDESV